MNIDLKRLTRLAAAALCAALAACASQPLTNVPLVWKPSAEPKFGGASFAAAAGANIQVVDFRDLRPQPSLIGDNHTLADARVTTGDDVGAFAAARVRVLFDKAGLRLVNDGGDPVVSGEVQQFYVDEGTTYDATVELHLTVRNRAGEVLWTGSASGTAHRFGRTYVLDNYYEALSDALQTAVTTVLQDGSFVRALAGQRAG